MNEQSEWSQMLARLSPFLISVGAATVALLIRDLLDPRQWRRLVRKAFASVASSIVVFAGIVAGYLVLVRYVGNEEGLLITVAGIVVSIGIFPATLIAGVLAFRRVESNPDWYINSRFVHSFQNGSWPTLSVDVRSECLPANVTAIKGCIFASKEHIGKYHLKAAVALGSGNRDLIDEITTSPRHGWMKVMRAVLKAQPGDLCEGTTWQERIPLYGNLTRLYGNLNGWFGNWTPTPTPNELYKWQDYAYMQIHALARGIDANGMQ